jgi:hypothetical protein
MSAFKDRIRNYAAQKETKVNPPEAQKVLETQTAPEVEARPVASAAAPESSVSSAAAPVASPAQPASEPSTGITEGKAKRGRPAGSKNKSSTPAVAAAMEGADLDLASAILAVSELLPKGTHITIASALDD